MAVCGCGGIGRRARLRAVSARVRVQVPSTAPDRAPRQVLTGCFFVPFAASGFSMLQLPHAAASACCSFCDTAFILHFWPFIFFRTFWSKSQVMLGKTSWISLKMYEYAHTVAYSRYACILMHHAPAHLENLAKSSALPHNNKNTTAFDVDLTNKKIPGLSERGFLHFTAVNQLK